MIKGLILLKLAPGSEMQALESIRRLTGVKDLTGAFGTWDAIATVEAENLETLAQVVVGKVRTQKGVTNTETLIEVKI